MDKKLWNKIFRQNTIVNENKVKYPLLDPKSPTFKYLKKKYVELTMTDKDLGVDWKGDIYKIVNGIAKKLR